MTERIKQVIEYAGLSTRAFALKCGMNQPTLDRMLKGINALNLNCVCAVLSNFPEISAEWFMRGQGSMLTANNTSLEAQRITKLVDTITTLQDTINEKNMTINVLSEQNQQLKNQLNK